MRLGTDSIDRRSFLGGGLALAAAAALPGCATGRKEPLDVFKGRFSRLLLNLNYHRVEIGLPEPFSLLHVSDTHLTAAYPDELPMRLRQCADRTEIFGGLQEDAFATTLAWARKHVDYIVHTGDLIDFQSRANFDLVRKYFGEAGVPLAACVGNHEYYRREAPHERTRAPGYDERSRPELAAAFGFDPTFHATVLGGVNFVLIDDVHGTVTAEQAARFRAEAKKGLPIVLCMHVPFYMERSWQVCAKFWSRAEREGAAIHFRSAAIPDPAGEYKLQLTDPVTKDFIAYLRGEPLLKAILAGHVHFAIEERFSPTAMQYTVGGNYLYAGSEIFFT